MQKFSRNLKQAGISLLEVLLSLTIIAIILVMATRYFFLANNNNRVNETRQEVGSLISAINAWKGQNGPYVPGLTISELYNDGLIARSSSLVVTGPENQATARLYDPWGQEITVTSTNQNAQIAVPLPSRSDCVAILNSYPDGACSNNQFNLTIT